MLGTIHGDSPTSVLDRVVHEMGISRRAFMATDIIIALGLFRNKATTRSAVAGVMILDVDKVFSTDELAAYGASADINPLQ